MNEKPNSSRGENDPRQRNLIVPVGNQLQGPSGNGNGSSPPNENRRLSTGTITNARSINGSSTIAQRNASCSGQHIPLRSSENQSQITNPKYAGRGVSGDLLDDQNRLSLSANLGAVALNRRENFNGGDQDLGYACQRVQDWPTPSLRVFSKYSGGPRGVSGDVRQCHPDKPIPKYAGSLADCTPSGDFKPNWAQLEKATYKPTEQHSSGNGEAVRRQIENQSQGAIPKTDRQNFISNGISGNAQQSNLHTSSVNQSQGAIPKITRQISDGGAQADYIASGDAQPKLFDRRDADKPSRISSRDATSKYSRTEVGDANYEATNLPKLTKALNPNAPEFKISPSDPEAKLEDNNLEDWKDEYKLQSTIVYKLGEFKRLLKKLDEKGVLKCNVKLSNAIKKTTLPENTHVVGLANLIPSEAALFAILGRNAANIFKTFVIQDTTTRRMMELFNRKCVPIVVQEIHDPDYYTEAVYNAIEKLITRLGVTHKHPKCIQYIKLMENYLNFAKSLFRECLKGEMNHLLLNDWENNSQLLEEYNKKRVHQATKDQNTFFTDQHSGDHTKSFYDQIDVKVCLNTRRDLFSDEPCYMFTDLNNPFPINVSVNSRGNILYRFKFDIFVELTRDMGVRMSCPEFGIFVAVSAFGTNFSVLHPQGRAFKKKGALQMQSFNKDVYRFARFTKDKQLLLTKSTTDIIFELSDNELEKTNRQGTVQCVTRDDTVDVLQSEGRFGPETADECLILACNAKYEHAVKNDNVILGSVKIVQMPAGNISLYRDNKHLHIQILPGLGVCQIFTPEYKVRADSNHRAMNFLLKKDFNRVLIHQNKFIVRRHDLSAGFDEENCLKSSFSCPKYDS